MSTHLPKQLEQEIAQDLFAGRKREAIQRYHELTGEGLKESQDFIGALEAALRAKAPRKFMHAAAPKGCLGRAALLGILGVGVVLVVHLVRALYG